MAEAFLHRVAAHVLERSPKNPERTAVILPSQRAAVYFRKHYSQLVKQVQFAPQLLTLDQLVAKCTTLEAGDNIELLFQLYRSHTEIWQSEAEPFDRFLKWAPIALSDFSEIDAYLVDAKAFFRDLSNIKEIEGWSLNADELTSTQQNYVWFWKKIGELYFHFSNSLRQSGKAYAGMLFRDAAEQIKSGKATPDFDHLYFCGFNALSTSEEQIMRTLVDSGKAEMLWDADRFYVEYSEHEAGHFLRKNLKKFPAFPHWNENHLREGEKTIALTAAPNEVAQCDVMAELISQSDSTENTAVVLTNENLLSPVLNALPENVDKVNVTMGLKTLHSPLHSLFDLLFDWIRARNENGQYHYRYLFRLLKHPFLNFSPKVSQTSNKLVAHIKANNKVFVRPDDLGEWGADATLLKLISELSPEHPDAAAQLRAQWAMVHFVLGTMEGGHYPIEKEHLYHYIKALRRIEALVERYPNELRGEGYPRIFHALTSSEKLNFVGEPLEGLQVMGMLESRALDFDHLIILSCNEHHMPGTSMGQSLIPFDLKQFYQLPGRNEKEAIYAYYFYRLIQRAKRVDLLYSTDSNNWQGSEPSRYLAQIAHDFKDVPNVRVNRQIARTTAAETIERATSVPKTPEVISALRKKLQQGLSPSALNTYLQCPLNFYYQYILGHREDEEVDETIDASTLGSVVHEVLEKLYTPHIKKGPLSPDDVLAMRKQVREMTRAELDEQYSAGGTQFGVNHLIYEVAVQFSDRFLQREAQELRKLAADNQFVEIVMLEEKLKYNMPVELADGTLQVKLHGNADRIDRVGRTVRVIDYKTGVVKTPDVSLSNPELELAEPRKSKALQLMTYALMYRRMVGENTGLTAANVSMRNLNEFLIPVKWAKDSDLDDSIIDTFETQLKEIVRGMLNPEVPFSHHPDAKYCVLCDMDGDGE